MTVDGEAFRDRVLADVIAAPLRHSAAYRGASVRAQWEETERFARQRAALHRKDLSATDADAETAVQEAIVSWLELSHSEGSSYRVVTAISSVARSLLQSTGQSMILRVCKGDPGREILRWRFISLMLPPGILLAAASDQESAPADAVRLLSQSIAPDGYVAELHLHHAAMTSFEDVWASLHYTAIVTPGELVRSLCDKRARCPKLHSGPCPTGTTNRGRSSGDRKHMTEWADLLRQAFIARFVVSQHSWHTGVELKCCNECNSTRLWLNALRFFVNGRIRPYSLAATPYPWPDNRVAIERLRRKSASRATRGLGPQTSVHVLGDAADERSFLVRAMAYVRHQRGNAFDQGFETLLVQYLRVKTAVFKLLVHAPGEHGLRRFLEHFAQIKVYAPESDLVRPRLLPEPGLKVGAREYRVAPDAWFKILRRDDPGIEEDATKKPAGPESAWLIHFKRESHDHRLPLYGSAIRKMENEADQIGRALASKPSRLKKLRGIDICGVEEDQPLWVSAETLRRVRLHSRKIAGQHPGFGLEPLRLTAHAGEDFIWLTSGMRAIAEPFHWKLIERGDRIGHGIAITFEPEEWWQRREGQVIWLKKVDRLLDLAFLAEYAKKLNTEQEEWLSEEIRRIFLTLNLDTEPELKAVSQIDPVKTAKEIWSCLGSRMTRVLMETPHWIYDANQPHLKWIHSLLWRHDLQKLAVEAIPVKVEGARNECELLVEARKQLIREVARWQVCIESNPSSNLVVGGLDSMGAAQDFLQRRPTRNEEGKIETLTWTISTDDPITFSTTLADEYAYAWAGMVLRKEKPYDPSYARALLDEAAATSMRMRFTVPDKDRAPRDRDKKEDRDRARRN